MTAQPHTSSYKTDENHGVLVQGKWFRQRLVSWAEEYYDGVNDKIALEYKEDILQKPDEAAIVQSVRFVDRILVNRRDEENHQRLVVYYQALRHLYVVFNGNEFTSKIDADGDWVMGYLTVTHRGFTR